MKDGTVTIVSPLIEKILSINTTAGMIWDLLDGTHSAEEIVDFLYEKFKHEGVSRATIEHDVHEILATFVKRQLVEQIVDSTET